MRHFKELKQAILMDGRIDAQEVELLQELLYEDGVIDKEEAEFLFELNDEVIKEDNDLSWDAFFINAITNFILDDKKSPGEIDEEEAKWLLQHIQKDGKIDDREKTLLANLKKHSKNFPDILNL